MNRGKDKDVREYHGDKPCIDPVVVERIATGHRKRKRQPGLADVWLFWWLKKWWRKFI